MIAAAWLSAAAAVTGAIAAVLSGMAAWYSWKAKLASDRAAAAALALRDALSPSRRRAS